MKRRRRLKDDCLRQCVAVVTGRAPRKVPHFVRRGKGQWLYDLRSWCDRVGYCMFAAQTRPSEYVLWNVKTARGVIHFGPEKKTGRGKPSWHAIVVSTKTGETIYDDGTPLQSTRGVIAIWPSRSRSRAG